MVTKKAESKGTKARIHKKAKTSAVKTLGAGSSSLITAHKEVPAVATHLHKEKVPSVKRALADDVGFRTPKARRNNNPVGRLLFASGRFVGTIQKSLKRKKG